MDRREAIELLKPFRNCMVDQHGCPISDVVFALDLAIEALKREIEYGQMVVDFTKGETMKSDEWKYDTTCDAESATTTDCISRKRAINALCEECMHGGYDTCSADYTEVAILHNLPPVAPPKRVVAEIKVDTEELVERIKEEYQLGQERGRLIDADKLLQELFTIDEEEWTTPEIRAILENAPTIITPTVSEDCISRADLIKSFLADNECRREEAKACMCSLDLMLELIEDAPPVTPTERMGEWVSNHSGYWECSECGLRVLVYAKGNYCPNCGAKMGGDTE